MTHDPDQSAINDLDRLLDRERAALLAGDLDAIGPLLERKEVLIDAINTQGPHTREGMSSVHGKVLRNQELLDGALQGIRKVAARMATVRRIRRNLETYDQSGQKSEIPGFIEHKVEKRA